MTYIPMRHGLLLMIMNEELFEEQSYLIEQLLTKQIPTYYDQ